MDHATSTIVDLCAKYLVAERLGKQASFLANVRTMAANKTNVVTQDAQTFSGAPLPKWHIDMGNEREQTLTKIFVGAFQGSDGAARAKVGTFSLFCAGALIASMQA